MKFLSTLDALIEKIIKALLGIATFGVMIMVFAQVVFRYFLPISIGGLEELPLYLMLAEIWFGAILLCRDGTHTSIDFLAPLLKKIPLVQLIVNIILDIITVVALIWCATLLYEYMVSLMVAKTISAGLGFPMWIVSFMMCLSAVLMAIYTFVHMIHRIKVYKETEGTVA